MNKDDKNEAVIETPKHQENCQAGIEEPAKVMSGPEIEARLRKLKKIVLFRHIAEHYATEHLRITAPLKQAGIELIPVDPGDLDPLSYISKADAILFQRDFAFVSTSYLDIIQTARREKKLILYEIDDLLYDLPADYPDPVAIRHYAKASIPMLEGLMEADLVFVSTPELAQALSGLNENILVRPNYLDDALWTLNPPAQPKAEEGMLTLGLMGTNSHTIDLESIAGVLIRLFEKYPERLRLKVWGTQLPDSLIDRPEVEWIPSYTYEYSVFVPYFQAQKADIFLAPLLAGRFNACKSALKFLEYSALGVPGVYSRIAPYERIIVNGENGFLADTAEEWEKALCSLIESPELRYRMATAAQKTVRGEHLLSQNVRSWEDILEGLPTGAYRQSGNRDERNRLLQAIFIRNRTQRQYDDTVLAEHIHNVQALEYDNRVLREQIHSHISEIDRIHQSRGWRLVLFLRSVIFRLVPQFWKLPEHLKKNYKLIKRSGLSDSAYYTKHNPDVKSNYPDPLIHFLLHGGAEGRRPSEYFDPDFYLENNPDVQESGINPLVHYLRFGKQEGRFSGVDSFENTPSHRSKINFPEDFRRFLGYVRVYGLKNALQKARQTLASSASSGGSFDKQSKSFINNSFENLLLGDEKQAELPTWDKSLSVVIPVKNAGPEFAYLLKTLKNQNGFREIEIVIVDSGSTDGSVDVAHEFGAKVISIAPEDFTHSYARNLGADNATGDLLFFTVQDALPGSPSTLYEMASVMFNHDVAAVSCAETPREDSDFYYRQGCWNHYEFLQVNQGDRIMAMPKRDDQISLRKNAQLSDIACLISRDLFMQYHYRRGYAEDLDLGLRLIHDDYKIAFLGSMRMIHSHNRSPFYYLKRGYVDNLFLSDIFTDFVIPKVSLPKIGPDLRYTWARLSALCTNFDKDTCPLPIERFAQALSDFSAPLPAGDVTWSAPDFHSPYLDAPATAFLDELLGSDDTSLEANGFIYLTVQGHMQVSLRYLKNSYEVIDDSLREELKQSLYKSFSIVVGASLAYCYRNMSPAEQNDFENTHKFLIRGV